MADLWSGFEHDPRDPAYAPVRASDRDRDVILHALGDAYAEGRLNREEYDERSDQVAAARTLGELPLLLADLVPTTALEARNAFVPATSDLRNGQPTSIGRIGRRRGGPSSCPRRSAG